MSKKPSADKVATLNAELDGLTAERRVARAVEAFGEKFALASSMGAEDQVLTDMVCRTAPTMRIFTLDTGRLPPETYELIERTNERYGIRTQVMFPDSREVEDMVNQEGPNLFYRGTELRKRCCLVRKVLPLRRALQGLDAWMTGLRREQSGTRSELSVAEWDESNELVKVNPLADWTDKQVWRYIRERDVPYSALHDRGYPSIGCGPCTRAVEQGADIRSGRWWWERPEQKECGLHVVDGKLGRKREDGAAPPR